MDIDAPESEQKKPDIPTSNDETDPDPIIATYNVFTNPALSSTRKLLILQHPNRQHQVSEPYKQINEVRIKPSSGMIEVDVPLEYQDPGYDRDKGMTWGSALQKSMAGKSGGSHGLAGGFGVGVPAGRGGKQRDEDRVYEWSEAVRQDKVLRTQTLGGMYSHGEDCRWMVGQFKGKNLHLTPATSEIQLRPQMHHLDARAEQDRLARPRDGGPLPGAPGADAKAAVPKAITMTVKSSANGNEVTTETMTDRLRHVQMESWQRLNYVDEESNEAWDTSDRVFTYRGKTGRGDVKGKGKMDPEDPDLEKTAPKLSTRWAEEDLMRAVAGKDRADVLEGYGSTAAGGIKDEDDVEVVKSEDVEMGNSDVKKATAANGQGKATAMATSRKVARP